ncbi:hypothetical protein BC939DRAFT_244991 [Gamsiella multidivaricata]|uniref:uncharacterized protein n=1 Tax=Gamsiella multidivaricata TaxID=101098 RepID=UPI00221FBE02|nr:uncharacterized protein BC939DRAFT_244991 [Gamsiella multidivaricata]KAI7820063.1 hypothetical protein BC939DRAFT_244991 [Gamsiella multidivaricata]
MLDPLRKRLSLTRAQNKHAGKERGRERGEGGGKRRDEGAGQRRRLSDSPLSKSPSYPSFVHKSQILISSSGIKSNWTIRYTRLCTIPEIRTTTHADRLSSHSFLPLLFVLKIDIYVKFLSFFSFLVHVISSSVLLFSLAPLLIREGAFNHSSLSFFVFQLTSLVFLW